MIPVTPNAILQRIRTFGNRFFHRFGIHCATHQIRLILVSSVVITSLLFPAIAIYSSTESHFFDGLTLRVLDSFLTVDDMSAYFMDHDLRHLWEGHANLRVREDSVARARCGMDPIIREERLLITSVSLEEGLEALEPNVLLATREIEHSISEALAAQGIRCLTRPGGSCFHLSPLPFWAHLDSSLADDDGILDVSQNISVSGIPIRPDTVLSGHTYRQGSSTTIDSAVFLALSYFFPDGDCVGNAGHMRWLRVLSDVADHRGDLIGQPQPPTLIALEYDKQASTRWPFSVFTIFCMASYFAYFVYSVTAMQRIVTVHSRFGLALTGLIEIIVSTLTSLSVCALVGFRVTMVPWELLPLIVIFIGSEHMFSIVDAVLGTHISLPVKERIAQGLSKAGTSNSLKSMSYNTILGVIAFFSTGAIRQFCAFSIVVLVAHWFLVHTFFVTVLSIDIQRLELEELIRQEPTLAPRRLEQSPTPSKHPRSILGKLSALYRNMVKGRPAKNISLLVLLAITATLYYATYPSTPRDRFDPRESTPRGALAKLRKVDAGDKASPAYHIWQTLNPSDDPLIHVRIESPTILVLAPEGEDYASGDAVPEHEKQYRPRGSRAARLWARLGRPVVWMLKTMVFPITATVLLLYALLLYLLKDAELLEAQRNRPDSDAPTAAEQPPVFDVNISFNTLPRAFRSDIELIASSTDGNVVAAVGLQNELVLWIGDKRLRVGVDVSSLLLGNGSTSSPSTTLTSIAVDEAGTMCAVGAGSGAVGVWFIAKGQVKSSSMLSSDYATSPVTALYFGQPDVSSGSPLYVSHENGTVVKWAPGESVTPYFITPSASASLVKSLLFPVHASSRLLVGYSLDDGRLELRDVDSVNTTLLQCCIAGGNATDLVVKAAACNVELDGKRRLVVAVATQAGIVSLWDAEAGACIIILDEQHGDINNLRLCPLYPRTCSTCGELTIEGFMLSVSVGQVVLFYQACLNLPTRRCSCPSNQPQPLLGGSLIRHRARSTSNVSLSSLSGTNTPKRSRSRAPSASSTLSPHPSMMFPVSGHGVHSRRVSEKDPVRRNLDAVLNSDGDEYDYHPVGPQDVTPLSSFQTPNAHSSIWQNLTVVQVADATFERGWWDVVDDVVVGIRRKPRPPFVKTNGETHVQGKPETAFGLSASALERWELWKFDPAKSQVQVSGLALLNCDPVEEPPVKRRYENGEGNARGRITAPIPRRKSAGPVVPRLHFTRVSPLTTTTSICVAGFGNTVGIFKCNDDLRQAARSI